jgi:HAMP domain-containing protein
LGALLLVATVGYWQTTTGTQASAVPASGSGQPSASGPVAVQHSSDAHQLLVGAAVALAFMVALSIVFGWVAAGRVLRPLRTITTTTRHISATNLHERLNLTGPNDELKELGETFDELLERLEKSFHLER